MQALRVVIPPKAGHERLNHQLVSDGQTHKPKIRATREKLDPKILAECLTEHFRADIECDRDALNDLIAQYELPGAVIRNLAAAQTELRRAVMSIAGAAAQTEA